jgi:hypothetical protein
MSKKNIFFSLIGNSLVTTLILTSCYAATPIAPVSMTATQEASPNTIVPAATATTIPAVTDIPTPPATATQAASATAVPTTQLTAQVIPAMNAYCRKGPGTGYYEITYLQTGSAYNVIARNSINTWWQIQAPGNIQCWMGDPNASKQGPVDQAPIVYVPNLPVTPSTFGVSSRTCTTAPITTSVSFRWTAVQNVTGYRIYRNGTVVTTTGPNETASHDNNSLLGITLVYELEAFNDYGVAPRLSVTVHSCN